MNNILADKVLASLRNLVNNATPFNILFMLYIFFEITTFTKLGDKVAMIFRIVNIHKFDYILMVHFLHDGDLIVEQVNVGNIHAFKFDDFDSIPYIFVIVFDSFVNFASESAADEMFEIEAVWSYPLFAF